MEEAATEEAASLEAASEDAASEDADKGKYMAVFTGYNVLFLGILLFAGFLCL